MTTTSSSATRSSSLASAALEALAPYADARGFLRGPGNARETRVASAEDAIATSARTAVRRLDTSLRQQSELRTGVIMGPKPNTSALLFS